MALSKSGVVFTFVALVAVMVILVVAFSMHRVSFTDSYAPVESRIMSMNEFLQGFHEDASRAMYIAGFRSFIALEDYVSENGEYLNDTEYFFRLLFYNGSIGNESYPIVNDSSFYVYQSRVAEIADQLDIDFYSDVRGVRMYQQDPWVVTVEVDIFVNATDRRGLASWEYEETLTGKIPIEGLRDPLYAVETLGKLPVAVHRTNVTVFVNDTADRNDTSGLQYHLNNSFYVNSTWAPAFIQRFEKDLTPSPFGIESLVNLQVLADQGVTISTNNISVVDYIYFNDETTDNMCDIQNMEFEPEFWFILDQNHSGVYQIEGNLEYNPC